MGRREAVLLCDDGIIGWGVACALQLVIFASLLVQPQGLHLVRNKRVAAQLIEPEPLGQIEHMPELGWKLGYPMVIILIASICGWLYRNFKRRDWL